MPLRKRGKPARALTVLSNSQQLIDIWTERSQNAFARNFAGTRAQNKLRTDVGVHFHDLKQDQKAPVLKFSEFQTLQIIKQLHETVQDLTKSVPGRKHCEMTRDLLRELLDEMEVDEVELQRIKSRALQRRVDSLESELSKSKQSHTDLQSRVDEFCQSVGGRSTEHAPAKAGARASEVRPRRTDSDFMILEDDDNLRKETVQVSEERLSASKATRASKERPSASTEAQRGRSHVLDGNVSSGQKRAPLAPTQVRENRTTTAAKRLLDDVSDTTLTTSQPPPIKRRSIQQNNGTSRLEAWIDDTVPRSMRDELQRSQTDSQKAGAHSDISQRTQSDKVALLIQSEDSTLRLDDLPDTIHENIKSLIADFDERSDSWRNMVTTHCIRQSVRSQGSAYSIKHGEMAACRTCTTTRNVCLRIDDGTLVLLPMPRSLRTSDDPKQLGFWRNENRGRAPADIWER